MGAILVALPHFGARGYGGGARGWGPRRDVVRGGAGDRLHAALGDRCLTRIAQKNGIAIRDRKSAAVVVRLIVSLLPETVTPEVLLRLLVQRPGRRRCPHELRSGRCIAGLRMRLIGFLNVEAATGLFDGGENLKASL